MKNKIKGFTLIELLVVIAIIGILSAIVLASLGTARSKGQDAAAIADLDDARAQAENYYGSNSNSYSSVCTTSTGSTPGGIQDMMLGAATAEGGTFTSGATTAAAAGVVACHDAAASGSTASTWAAASPIKNTIRGFSFWCVDSTGTSTSVSAFAASATHC